MSDENGNKLVPADRSAGKQIGPVTRLTDRGYGYGYGYGYAGVQEQSGDFNLREYLRIVLKNKWIILTLVVVTTTLVAVAAFRVQDVYIASAMIQVGDDNPGMIAGDQPIYVYDVDGKRFNTQLRLLQAPDLMRKVVIQTDLEHNPKFFSTKPATLSAAFTTLLRSAPPASVDTSSDTLSAPVDPNAPVDSATAARLAPYVGGVAGGLSVDEIKDTQLVTISYQHHDPEIAAKVANAVAEGFIQEDLNQRVNTKSTASTFLQKRIADLQAQIRAGEERLLNYAKTHEIVSLGESEQDNTVVARLKSLNDDLIKSQATLRSLEVARDTLKAAQEADDIMRIPAAQSDPGAIELSKRLTELRQRLSELTQKYTDEYPAVKQVKEQIALVETDIQRVKQRILASSEDQYQAAVRSEKKANEEFERARSETMDQNEAFINYKIIQQEVETNKKQLESILQRAKEVDISAASERSPVTIKNRAEIPEGAAGPDRRRWVLMAFAGSLFFGVAFAFGREYLDQSIRSVEDIDRVVRLPSLGVIPALSAGTKRRVSRRVLAPANGSEAAASAGAPGLLTALEAKSSAAEAYRQLRTSVLLSSAGHTAKLLMVTSSQPREGKTTTAVNTAISLAQTGASTVIVDCDMRKPRVHQLLNAPNHVGLSLYLSGQNEDLSLLVQPHQIPNLSILPSGPIPPNPAELLGSEQMRKLLEDLTARFDHVVLDTPPVVSFADPVILSTLVDGVILVVRGGFSSRGIVLRSRQILTDVGAKIYGVVLNDADMKASDAYYYYGSYYQSYYGKDDEHDAR